MKQVEFNDEILAEEIKPFTDEFNRLFEVFYGSLPEGYDKAIAEFDFAHKLEMAQHDWQLNEVHKLVEDLTIEKEQIKKDLEASNDYVLASNLERIEHNLTVLANRENLLSHFCVCEPYSVAGDLDKWLEDHYNIEL